MHNHHCSSCGGLLAAHPSDPQRLRCPYCRREYNNAAAEEHTRTLADLFDATKQEIIHNLRRKLYDAVTAEYISREKVLSACDALRTYLPDDFAANFFGTAAGKNVRALNRAIRAVDVEAQYEDIPLVVTFLAKSMTADGDCLLALNDLVERAYKTRDLALFSRYATLVSEEAERVYGGVYETALPREVFVAYSSKDMDKVMELVAELEEAGLACFVAARNLRHGVGSEEDYESALATAIDNCRTVVFVSSLNARSFGCDALRIELAYIKGKDLDRAPAEYGDDYAALPHTYKKPRVEYRIEETTGRNAADAIVEQFFSGYERVYTPEAVTERVMAQLFDTQAGRAPQNSPTPTPPPEPTPAPRKVDPMYAVGSVITFGTYEQDIVTEKKRFKKPVTTFVRKPIEWIVLANEGDRVLLISKYILDCQEGHFAKYARVSWENCSLRQWLNSTFLNDAFDSDEQARIIAKDQKSDKVVDTTEQVFCLNIEEMYQYFASDAARATTETPVAEARGCNGIYWLRMHDFAGDRAPIAYSSGDTRITGLSLYTNLGVRPALWLNLES